MRDSVDPQAAAEAKDVREHGRMAASVQRAFTHIDEDGGELLFISTSRGYFTFFPEPPSSADAEREP